MTALPNLHTLFLSKVRTEETYQALATLPIEQLVLYPIRGFHGLHGLEQIRTLRRLKVLCYKNIDSVESVAALPELEYVEFAACRGLPSLAPLASAPNLRGIRLFDCGPLNWDGVRENLIARGVEVDDAFSY